MYAQSHPIRRGETLVPLVLLIALMSTIHLSIQAGRSAAHPDAPNAPPAQQAIRLEPGPEPMIGDGPVPSPAQIAHPPLPHAATPQVTQAIGPPPAEEWLPQQAMSH